jgi:hypothetical protein
VAECIVGIRHQQAGLPDRSVADNHTFYVIHLLSFTNSSQIWHVLPQSLQINQSNVLTSTWKWKQRQIYTDLTVDVWELFSNTSYFRPPNSRIEILCEVMISRILWFVMEISGRNWTQVYSKFRSMWNSSFFVPVPVPEERSESNVTGLKNSRQRQQKHHAKSAHDILSRYKAHCPHVISRPDHEWGQIKPNKLWI